MPQAAIGSYAKGCLAGGAMLPAEGPRWQAVRLSRNRNWGHPAMIGFLQDFAGKLPGINGWPGLLVGDISQPRGGPMRTGHASHQIGLDADVWLTPMPGRVLSRQEREDLEPVNLVADDWNDVAPERWTPAHLALIKAAAAAKARGAGVREPRHQKGAVPRSRGGPGMARPRASALWPQLPHAHPPRLPGRRGELRTAGSAAGRRRMRG